MTIEVTELRTLASIATDGTLTGYERRAPTRLAQAVDSALCASATCAVCGWTGLAYAPYTHPTTGSYRIVAACPRCGQADEF